MDAVWDLSWRAYPAAALMAVGAVLALRGGYAFMHGFDLPFDGPTRVLRGLRGFRRGIVGLALLGLGAAWLWHIDWVLALSLAIGGEELLESTFHIQALGIAERNERRRVSPGRGRAAAVRAAGADPGPPPLGGLAAATVWAPPRRAHAGARPVRRY